MSQDTHKLARRLKVASLAALVVMTVPALADDYNCKKEITVTGDASFFGEEGGKSNAISRWRNAAIADYGVFYGDNKIANEGIGLITAPCAPGWFALFGVMICEAKGRPCVIKTELECTHKDSQDCDPTIKWIQSKLSAKNYQVGQIDGISGEKFEQAIEKFKKENNMPDGSSIYDVIEVLNKSVQRTTAVESEAKALLSNSNVRRRR
jgi:hypothetical protein